MHDSTSGPRRKILLTGASSFTGYWFARELTDFGHDVTTTFRRPSVESYSGIRSKRVEEICRRCTPVFHCNFGDEKFLALCESGFDVFCHHGAEVANYKHPDFDARNAVIANTCGGVQVLRNLSETGCSRMVLTCSVFEGGRGAGDPELSHVSPYGLSKAMTSQFFRFYAHRHRMKLCEFVIANPFGPMEDPKFTSYLFQCWLSNQTPSVRTPMYVRDNIPVSLMAQGYRFCVESENAPLIFEPSGFIGSQQDFALRVARSVSPFLGKECKISSEVQSDFSEPLVRINRGPSLLSSKWDEPRFWRDFAAFYHTQSS